MSFNSVNQLADVCRGCLATECRMVSALLFETEFKDLTGITISQSDGLPLWICYECTALLQRYVEFRNKIVKSHGILCQYLMLGDEPFSCTKDYDIPGVQPEQLGESIENTATHLSVIKTESLVKHEIDVCDYEDDATEEDRVNDSQMDVASTSSAYEYCDVKQSIRLMQPNHEKRTEQRELEVEISPLVSDIGMSGDTTTVQVEIKEESSLSVFDDNITIEECRIEQQIELSKREKQTNQKNINDQSMNQSISLSQSTAGHTPLAIAATTLGPPPTASSLNQIKRPVKRRTARMRRRLDKHTGRDDEATTSTSTGSRGPRGKNAQYYRDYRARKRAEQEKESLNRTSDPSTTADSSTFSVAGSVTSKKRKSAAEYQREYRARKKAKRDNILIESLAVIPSISTGGLTTTHQSTIVDQLTTAGSSINPQTTAGSSINPTTTAGPSTSIDIGFAKLTRRKTPADYQR